MSLDAPPRSIPGFGGAASAYNGGMFRRAFGQATPLTRDDDQIWRRRDHKLRALAHFAAEAGPTRPVLLTAHFPATLAALAAALQVATVAYDTYADAFDRDRLLAALAPTPNPARRPLLALVDSLPTGAQLEAWLKPPGGGRANEIKALALAAERHPLRAHDDALVTQLAELPYATRLSFHLALDDPLLARFNGPQVGTVMDSLQLAPDTPLSQGLLSQSIRQAQEKLARYATGDGPAESAEAWCAAYLPAKPD